MISPSQPAFWRTLLAFTAALAVFAITNTFQLAQKLAVSPFASKTILGMLAFFTLTLLTSSAGFALTFSGHRQTRVTTLNTPASSRFRFGAWLAFGLILLGFPVLYAQPAFAKLFQAGPIRFLIFWLLALGGMFILKLARPAWGFPVTLAAALILQAAVNRLASYLPALTAYPFALGWSETSRFYFPSLFLSQKIYGQVYPWPILHPSLHLLLTPPYWFNAPLWAHRAWQIGLRFGLVGLIAPALLARFGEVRRDARYWLILAWMVVYLFNLPLYLHLPLMVFPILWFFRINRERRTWVLLILASIWAGLSRLNWYPMPGLILAALYLLESESREIKTTKPSLASLLLYWWKPAAWILVGTSVAYAVSQVYIALSANPPGDFFTSLSSDLLWYRLWPNETYWLGILPGIALFSLPLWVLIVNEFNGGRMWKQRFAILAMLFALFIGGIFVSLKIGGGADLHNMDAYAVLLLIVAAYAFFRTEKPIPWPVAALLVLVVAWFGQQANSGVAHYDQAVSQATLTALQRRVDVTKGEVLFITQRHLISMNMLKGVVLIPEYEREDLMEMAMAQNDTYLRQFEQDVAAQRFAVIVVDPLKFNLLGSSYEMGEENNAWARRVVKPVLCWYRADQVFAADRIVIYVPREAGKECP